jgi:hypothetical protein
MDRKFHMDSFERLLKERSDEFRMYPAGKVWHSIYNNIYPGRRWPSAIITIMLIATFPLVGYLNTNKPIQTQERNAALNSASNYAITSPLTTGKLTINNKENRHVTVLNFNTTLIKSPALENTSDNNITQKKHWLYTIHNTAMLPINLYSNKTTAAADKNNINDNKLNALATGENSETERRNNSFERNTLLEQYNIQNQQLSKKWSDKLALQVYASPSVVYGIFSTQKTNSSSMDDGSNTANQNSSIGLEAGTAMQYSLTDAIKVKAGLQFNYASYDVETANTPAALNDGVSSSDLLARSNDYANGVTLHNETYQFSLPVGLELKLLKNHNLQWNAGATIQPTYIAGGNAYLLSSYNHNFIDESSLINRWNLNAGLETFITYKVNGMTWQFGPQFRYQFSSTYGKNYGVDERLAVFGVKIGVSKVLH